MTEPAHEIEISHGPHVDRDQHDPRVMTATCMGCCREVPKDTLEMGSCPDCARPATFAEWAANRRALRISLLKSELWQAKYEVERNSDPSVDRYGADLAFERKRKPRLAEERLASLCQQLAAVVAGGTER
jgi:hypothetical protein